MEYAIAVEEKLGTTGQKNNNLQAQITLGLKQGYGGFLQEKLEVLNLLSGLYKACLWDGEEMVTFNVKEAVTTYAYRHWDNPDEIVAEHEPSLELTSDKNPLFTADMSDEEWKTLVEWFVARLASKFKQFRVYVSYTRTEELKILQADGQFSYV